jgi:hypothetical protein
MMGRGELVGCVVAAAFCMTRMGVTPAMQHGPTSGSLHCAWVSACEQVTGMRARLLLP